MMSEVKDKKASQKEDNQKVKANAKKNSTKLAEALKKNLLRRKQKQG
jgi:hypothetical protein